MSLGDAVGTWVGLLVGDKVGANVGWFVGLEVGENVGDDVMIGQHSSTQPDGRGVPSTGQRTVQNDVTLNTLWQKSTQPIGSGALATIGHALAQVNGFNGNGVFISGQ